MNYVQLTYQTVFDMFGTLASSNVPPAWVEDGLMTFRADPCYLVILVDIILNSQNEEITTIAAIEFKNTVYFHWVLCDAN